MHVYKWPINCIRTRTEKKRTPSAQQAVMAYSVLFDVRQTTGELKHAIAAVYNRHKQRQAGKDRVVPSSGESVTVLKNSENERFDCKFNFILMSAQLHGCSDLFPGVGSETRDPGF